MIDFDPNALPEQKKSQLWATYRANRTPKFKIHNGKGQAKQALDWASWCSVTVYYRPRLDLIWTEVGTLDRNDYDRTNPSWRTDMAHDSARLKDKMDAIA